MSAPVQPTSARFPSAARLLKRADFENVYQNGRRHFSPHMTMFFLRREGGRGPRVGFAVGRALGGAVERNRVRRRLREAARLHWRQLAGAVDVVIHPKRTALKAKFGELAGEVARAFEKIAGEAGGTG